MRYGLTFFKMFFKGDGVKRRRLAGLVEMKHPARQASIEVERRIKKDYVESLNELECELIAYRPTVGFMLSGRMFFRGGVKLKMARALAQRINRFRPSTHTQEECFQELTVIAWKLVWFLEGEIRHNKFMRCKHTNNDVISNSKLLRLTMSFFRHHVTVIESHEKARFNDATYGGFRYQNRENIRPAYIEACRYRPSPL